MLIRQRECYSYYRDVHTITSLYAPSTAFLLAQGRSNGGVYGYIPCPGNGFFATFTGNGG